MPSETPHDQWEGSHPRRHVCMGGLGCLFAAESSGIVQSLLRVISRRLRVVEVGVDIGSRRAPNTPHDLIHA